MFQVVRFQPKDFRQRRSDGNGGWIWNMQGVRRVLYRLDRLKGREAEVIVEGEKDVDAAGLDVKVLALPDLPPKGDVNDYLATPRSCVTRPALWGQIGGSGGSSFRTPNARVVDGRRSVLPSRAGGCAARSPTRAALSAHKGPGDVRTAPGDIRCREAVAVPKASATRRNDPSLVNRSGSVTL